MDTRRALLVDAFTTEPLTGNAAGVVPDASGLSDEQMQAVARELSVSETAFLHPSESADRRIRYFTPTQEVDLCGHATIAAHAHLFEDDVLDAGSHTLETNVGDLDIELTDDGVVWMTQAEPTVHPVDVDYDRASNALGVPVDSLRAVADDLPAAVASTGLPFLVLGVDFLDAVGGATPDMSAVAELAEEHDAAGVYLFTFDTLTAEATLHARMFAPGAGVPEDPVTGTASGACGAYLRHVGAFDTLPDEMQFEQGEFLDRPGRVRVRVGDSVRVGGRAVTALDGSLVVPELDSDEILEV
ncbi:PhzF family phenazine biosynthesis protein [Haloprofundus marisrubri]|uniref:PhzF family phenazine biosynthesis protein n=1 Tax=Haloprofundus marisrubri TaxID=1514971 RepID=A0A0W1R8C7_9EURY|nr:PhzF family phenazine biosynthesis protein [Haloprofundus marisrubri]KTG09654.1 PhzF family phenazine biosynthesis protein [Haloprofundus marisrubri]